MVNICGFAATFNIERGALDPPSSVRQSLQTFFVGGGIALQMGERFAGEVK